MITCVNYRNLDRFGQFFQSQFRLRHKSFIERQSYDVQSFDGMEYDQYDIPATSYLVYTDDLGNALGVSRLTPTTHACMLRDLWPDLVKDKSLLDHDLIWEGTRYCIDQNLSAEHRQKIIHEMAIAYLEFGLSHGIKKIIGMMPTYIYRSVFERPGIEMEYLGDIKVIGRHKIRAVAIPVEERQLQNVRQKTGIKDTVLRFTDKTDQQGHLYGQAA